MGGQIGAQALELTSWQSIKQPLPPPNTAKLAFKVTLSQTPTWQLWEIKFSAQLFCCNLIRNRKRPTVKSIWAMPWLLGSHPNSSNSTPGTAPLCKLCTPARVTSANTSIWQNPLHRGLEWLETLDSQRHTFRFWGGGPGAGDWVQSDTPRTPNTACHNVTIQPFGFGPRPRVRTGSGQRWFCGSLPHPFPSES